VRVPVDRATGVLGGDKDEDMMAAPAAGVKGILDRGDGLE